MGVSSIAALLAIDDGSSSIASRRRLLQPALSLRHCTPLHCTALHMRCIASRIITRALTHRTFRPLIASTAAHSHFHFRVMAAIPPASVPAQPFSGLSAEQLEQFDRDGYLVLPNFFSSETADALKAHADELVEGLDMATHPRVSLSGGSSGGSQRLHSVIRPVPSAVHESS